MEIGSGILAVEGEGLLLCKSKQEMGVIF